MKKGLAISGLLPGIFEGVVDSILFSTKNINHQRWLITSALAKEGKTTAALGIAVSLSHRGKRVLLLDADLRRHSLSTCVGVNGNVGLAEIVKGEKDLAGGAQNLDDAGRLYLLGKGNGRIEPFEVLDSSKMQDILTQARSSFDFIIIDSPALEEAYDPLFLAPHVEGCLLIVQSERTGKGSIMGAIEKIHQAEGKLLGIVLNKEQRRMPGFLKRWF